MGEPAILVQPVILRGGPVVTSPLQLSLWASLLPPYDTAVLMGMSVVVLSLQPVILMGGPVVAFPLQLSLWASLLPHYDTAVLMGMSSVV